MSQELHHLFNAIRQDKLEQVKVAIKDNKALVNTKDDKNNTPLIVAAEHGNTGIVNALVKHGAHVNYQIPEKKLTPLMVAVQKGNVDTVNYLLENGADKTIVDALGNTALEYAKQQKKQDLIDAIEKH
jgi:hypothetical protein